MHVLAHMWVEVRELRSEKIVQFMSKCEMYVLNVPSEQYTYSGPAGESDIDVSLGNDEWMGLECGWRIENDWCVSDHNVIMIGVSWDERVGLEDSVLRWKRKSNVDWSDYARMIEKRAGETSMDEFVELELEQKIEKLMDWISDVNDVIFGRQQKENDWREFIGKEENSDPWSMVYKVCRGKKKTDVMSAMSVDKRMMVRWKETINVLLDEFFPESAMLCENESSTRSYGDKEFEWDEIARAVRGRMCVEWME